MGSNGSVIDLVMEAYPMLTPGFRKIADYLRTHWSDAAFMSAARLAAEVGVSESMVVRFAAELGFDGYSNFIEEIQAYVRESLLPSGRLGKGRQFDLTRDDGFVALRNAVFEQDALNLLATANDYANRYFDEAMDLLVDARTIYVVGLHGMVHLAHLFGHLFLRAGARVEVIVHGDTYLFSKIRRTGPKDAMVVFAYRRYTQRTLDAVHLAQGRGTKVLTITDALTSPPATLADVVLRTAVASHSVMASHVAGVALVYALADAYEGHGTNRDESRAIFAPMAPSALLSVGDDAASRDDGPEGRFDRSPGRQADSNGKPASRPGRSSEGDDR